MKIFFRDGRNPSMSKQDRAARKEEKERERERERERKKKRGRRWHNCSRKSSRGAIEERESEEK